MIVMSRFFTALAALLFALALLFFPQAGAEAARSGLLLCGETILPALFPYFVMSNLLIYGGLGARLSRVLQPIMSPLFHVGGSGGAALALGLAGGYPTGAATVRSLLEQCACTLEEAQSLLHFCNNSGPAFILAVAGSAVFGRMDLGLLLFAAHTLGALGTGLLLRRPSQPAHLKAAPGGKTPLPPGSLLTASVQKALTASLQVSAYVVDPELFPTLTSHSMAVANKLRDMDIELVILADYDVPLGVIPYQFKNRIIGTFPALYPAFEDTEGDIQRAVLERGVRITGATAYFADSDGRVGGIILQKAVEVQPGDDPEKLGRRVMEECEWPLLTRAVAAYCGGELNVRGNRVRFVTPAGN